MTRAVDTWPDELAFHAEDPRRRTLRPSWTSARPGAGPAPTTPGGWPGCATPASSTCAAPTATTAPAPTSACSRSLPARARRRRAARRLARPPHRPRRPVAGCCGARALARGLTGRAAAGPVPSARAACRPSPSSSGPGPTWTATTSTGCTGWSASGSSSPTCRSPTWCCASARPTARWLAVAHMRPTTGPDGLPAGRRRRRRCRRAVAPRLERGLARAAGSVRDAEPEWRGARAGAAARPCPVRRGGRGHRRAVPRRPTSAATRMPSALELTYLTTAGELLQMVGEGRFPFPGPMPDPEHAPRVGDGLVRLDRTGHVVYASPNALSAFRRLGRHRRPARRPPRPHHRPAVAPAPGALDEPRGSAALAAVLRFGEPRESEVEAQGATVLLRALPLSPGGEPRGRAGARPRRHRAAPPRPAAHRQGRDDPRDPPPGEEQPADGRRAAAPAGPPDGGAGGADGARGVGPAGVVDRDGARDAVAGAARTSVPFDEIADRVLAMCAEVAAPESRGRVVARGRSASCRPRSRRRWRWCSPSSCRTPWSTPPGRRTAAIEVRADAAATAPAAGRGRRRRRRAAARASTWPRARGSGCRSCARCRRASCGGEPSSVERGARAGSGTRRGARRSPLPARRGRRRPARLAGGSRGARPGRLRGRGRARRGA